MGKGHVQCKFSGFNIDAAYVTVFWDEELRYWLIAARLFQTASPLCSRVRMSMDVTNISLTTIHTGYT
jgi:hypothetical protein